jgi:hypothetical protein
MPQLPSGRPLLAFLAIIVGWPAAFWFLARDKMAARKTVQEEKKEFAVLREHLLEQLSVGEIEATNRIDDPLGAVPDQPFGHLNAAWASLKSGMEDGDQVWRFMAIWEEYYTPEERQGYAVVRNGEPLVWWVTEWRDLPRP